MMQYLKLIYLLPLLSHLLNFIKEAQATFKGPGSNEQKLASVVGQFVPLVREAAADGVISAGLADAIASGAPAIVSVVVQVLKFVHGGQVPLPGDQPPVQPPAQPPNTPPQQPPQAPPSAAPAYGVWQSGSMPDDASLKLWFAAGDSKWKSNGGMWTVTHSGQTPGNPPDGTGVISLGPIY